MICNVFGGTLNPTLLPVQCHCKPEWTFSPELQQLALNFLPTFSRHPSKQWPSFSRQCPRSSSVWALYVMHSSLTPPIRQRIQPFTTNKALSGSPLHRDRALFPGAPLPLPPVGGFGSGLRRLCTYVICNRCCRWSYNLMMG